MVIYSLYGVRVLFILDSPPVEAHEMCKLRANTNIYQFLEEGTFNTLSLTDVPSLVFS